eukprot:TRINITY_DN701_c3_g1_i1.p1 TRINITY_DN701_c3_g1~~TRINITY_DN701_c3_g1_i1.p1  ORF type:complete len:266 (-),score=93.19 TRINITY_DN701_c3_g1_i1:143-940(-)
MSSVYESDSLVSRGEEPPVLGEEVCSDERSNLIVNYLPQNMTDKELFSMFVTCGPLIQARIIRDRKSGYSYGYGFVHYESPSDATRAIETLSGLAIQNKTLKVSYARPNSELIKDSNLYVANLGQGIREDSLEAMFSTYGKILTLNLLKDPQTGIPKGVAFVRFSKQSEARDAISALNGTLLNGQEKPLLVKVAEEHGKQNNRYYMPHWEAGQHNNYPSPHMGRGSRGGGGPRGGYGRARHHHNGGNRFNPMNPGAAGRGNNYIY